MYVPNISDPLFNPADVDGYINTRVEEVKRQTFSGNPQKIDVPSFIEEWLSHCLLYFRLLEQQNFPSPSIVSLKKATLSAISGRCNSDLERISREIEGIQKTVGVYEEAGIDISGTAKKQIEVLEALKGRYAPLMRLEYL